MQTSKQTLSVSDMRLLDMVHKDKIEYIRLEMCDPYCRALGKLIPARDLEGYLLDGFKLICAWSVTSEFLSEFIDMETVDTANIKCQLYHDTYHKLPQIMCKNANIGRILIYPISNNRDPRTICLKQMDQLNNEFGYNLYSAFEHEFQMFTQNETESSLKPLWNYSRMFCSLALSEHEDFVFDCERALKEMDIPLECMHCEFGLGRYEWTMKPAFNIKSADNSFYYKQTIKQIAQNKYGFLASFATNPLCDKSYASNGAHFNHSLWDARSNDNVFYNNNGGGLSVIAKYWIGGILKHIDALTAFSVPTVNCYRRIKAHAWAPSNDSWGFNNRLCMIRVKTDGKKGTYIEYRLPCSAVNPYLVIASLLIAGMDGIRNNILPNTPPMGQKDGYPSNDKRYHKVPDSLKCAMDALLKDKLICDQIGDEFIKLYSGLKNMEIDDVQKYTRQFGDRIKAEQFLFSKL